MFLKHVQLLVSIKNEKEKKLATSIRPVFKAERFDKQLGFWDTLCSSNETV